MFEKAPKRTPLTLARQQRVLFGLTSSFLILRASTTLAAPPPSFQMPAADSERYGIEALRDHRVADAFQYFKYAFLVERTEAHLWNLAVTGAVADDPVLALIDLRNYIIYAEATTPHTADATRLIVGLYRRTGHLLIRGAPQVFLDGTEYYVAPDREVDVVPGEHTIAITKNGRAMRFTAISGAPTPVDVTSLSHP